MRHEDCVFHILDLKSQVSNSVWIKVQAPEPDDASSDLARGDRMVQSSNPDGMAFALTYGQRAENGARLARAIFARQWSC